jgi:predicted PurR-regulated permease PerM
VELLYFTATAIVLYVVADWILDRIETRRGRRFEHRTLIFFSILLGMALLVFAIIRQFLGP